MATQTINKIKGHDGTVITLPAVIGHTRPTGISTAFPRGEFDLSLHRDCEAEGANQFLGRVA